MASAMWPGLAMMLGAQAMEGNHIWCAESIGQAS